MEFNSFKFDGTNKGPFMKASFSFSSILYLCPTCMAINYLRIKHAYSEPYKNQSKVFFTYHLCQIKHKKTNFREQSNAHIFSRFTLVNHKVMFLFSYFVIEILVEQMWIIWEHRRKNVLKKSKFEYNAHLKLKKASESGVMFLYFSFKRWTRIQS